jgi:hypothetical protein
LCAGAGLAEEVAWVAAFAESASAVEDAGSSVGPLEQLASTKRGVRKKFE